MSSGIFCEQRCHRKAPYMSWLTPPLFWRMFGPFPRLLTPFLGVQEVGVGKFPCATFFLLVQLWMDPSALSDFGLFTKCWWRWLDEVILGTCTSYFTPQLSLQCYTNFPGGKLHRTQWGLFLIRMCLGLCYKFSIGLHMKNIQTPGAILCSTTSQAPLPNLYGRCPSPAHSLLPTNLRAAPPWCLPCTGQLWPMKGGAARAQQDWRCQKPWSCCLSANMGMPTLLCWRCMILRIALFSWFKIGLLGYQFVF